MVRTQVQLTEGQIEQLRVMAAQQRVSLAELIRRAVDLLLLREAATSDQERRDRALAAAGLFGSDESDTAARHDDYLDGAFGP